MLVERERRSAVSGPSAARRQPVPMDYNTPSLEFFPNRSKFSR
jgi:hypothetical protein